MVGAAERLFRRAFGLLRYQSILECLGAWAQWTTVDTGDWFDW